MRYKKIYKLYELPADKGIKIDLGPGIVYKDDSKYVVFFHIDGMYSYCETEKGNPVHLPASLELVKVNKNNYKIAT